MWHRLEIGWRRRGKKQAQIERMLGLPPNRIAKWKAGQGSPLPGELLALARHAGVSLDWACDDDASDDPPSAEPERVVLSELDQAVLDVARRIGHTEVLARLAERPAAAPSGPVTWLGPPRDETEADIRRRSEVNAKGADKRPKAKRSPGRT